MTSLNDDIINAILSYQERLDRYNLTKSEDKMLYVIGKLSKLPIRTAHLETTGVGRTVNALKKLGGEVGEAAKDLVMSWKDMVMEEEKAGQETSIEAEEDADSVYSSENESKDCQKQDLIKVNGNNHSNRYENESEGYSSKKEVPSKSSAGSLENKLSKQRYNSEQDDKNDDDTSTSSESSESSSSSSSSSESEEEKEKSRKREKHNSRKRSYSSESEERSNKRDNHKTRKRSYSSQSSSEEREKHSSKKSKKDKEKLTKDSHDYKHKSSKEDKPKKHENQDKHLSNKHRETSERSHKSIEKRRESSEKNKESSQKRKENSESHDSKHKQKKDADEESRHKSKKEPEDGKKQKNKRESEDSHSNHRLEKHRKREEKESDDSHSHHNSDKHRKHDEKTDKDSKSSHSSKHKDKESSHSSSEKKSSKDKEKRDKDKHESKKEKKDEKHSEKKSKETKEEKKSESTKLSKDSSSSSSSKQKVTTSDSSEKKNKIKKDKVKSASKEKIINGIGSESGASFEEALGMCGPLVSSPKKKSSSDRNRHGAPVDKFVDEGDQEPSRSKSKSSKHESGGSKSSSSSKMVVPELLKDEPPEPLNICLSSLLPEITPNYKPLGISLDSGPKRMCTDDEALSRVMANKNQRTKVYSGNKTVGKVESLFQLCVRILQDNIDALEYTGGVPYLILKPIMDRATPDQLFNLEHHNPYLIEDTDELWQLHCQKDFRTKKREEMESWRDMYMRCLDEREARLNVVKANIKQSQDKSIPVRTTKLAYIDSEFVKPPRNIARKQAKNGTVSTDRKTTPTQKIQALAKSGEAEKTAVPDPGRRAMERPSGSSSAAMKPKKAPLMAKTLSFLKNRFRR